MTAKNLLHFWFLSVNRYPHCVLTRFNITRLYSQHSQKTICLGLGVNSKLSHVCF